ncbi:MAG: 2-phospho-L-lactate transferase [Candidatus Syntropharchaeia archaeon]
MIVLSGGTGTPKLLRGLKEILPEEEITVIVNTAEDTWVSGNFVCPDIDTVLYTFSGMIDDEKWWGIREDTFETHFALKSLGHDEGMMIGDRDRATHIFRSELLRKGMSLTDVTKKLSNALGIEAEILPMSEDRVKTIVHTEEGEMEFQEFWVLRKGEPEVYDITFDGIERAKPSKEVLNAFEREDSVVIGPSNPITSIGPIISLCGMKEMLKEKFVVGISPIVGGKPVSGPAAKFMKAKGYEVSSYGIFRCYEDFLDLLIIDEKDDFQVEGIEIVKTDTMMTSLEKSIGLARFVMSQI